MTLVLAVASVPPAIESFQPRIDGRSLRVRTHIFKLIYSLFYLKKYMFDDAPLSRATRARSEVESIQCVLELVRVIDETRHVRELLFLTGITTKQQRELRCLRRERLNMADLVRIRLDRSVRPVPMSIDANNRLVNANLIRTDVAVGL